MHPVNAVFVGEFGNFESKPMTKTYIITRTFEGSKEYYNRTWSDDWSTSRYFWSNEFDRRTAETYPSKESAESYIKDLMDYNYKGYIQIEKIYV
jgi:hypothetical protein